MSGAENIRKHQFKRGEARTVESGRAGGLASGEAKRRRRSMRELVQALMDAPPPKWARTVGGIGCETYGEAIAAAQFQEAARGETPAYRAICETLGELTEQFEVKSPIVLGVIADELAEKAKREHEARRMQDMRP